MRLDLACGENVHPGYEGVDLRPAPHVTQLVDLARFPWPWPSESVEAIWCSHYVEHVVDLVAFMNECHRILRPGAEMTVMFPYQHSDRAWQDPTHVRALNLVSFDYYDATARAGLGPGYDAIVADFEIVDRELIVAEEVAKALAPEPVPEWMLRHCVNVIDDGIVKLRRR